MTLDFHLDVPHKWHKHGPYDLHNRKMEFTDVDVDFPRMKEGSLDGGFFALYLSDATQDKLGDYESTEAIWRQIIAINSCNLGNDDPEIFLGLEGGRLIHENLHQLGMYARAGVKYLTITHNKNTSWADSATDKVNIDGITAFGVEVVRECEKLGVLVDISHASDQAAIDILTASTRPVVATHSGCYALLEHPRNLRDYLIKMIASSGGVIGVPFARRFVGTKDGIIRHIDHICQLTGSCRHAAIGSDLDGAWMVDEVDGVQNWGAVVLDGLWDADYSDGDIDLIAGGNIMRLIG